MEVENLVLMRGQPVLHARNMVRVVMMKRRALNSKYQTKGTPRIPEEKTEREGDPLLCSGRV